MEHNAQQRKTAISMATTLHGNNTMTMATAFSWFERAMRWFVSLVQSKLKKLQEISVKEGS